MAAEKVSQLERKIAVATHVDFVNLDVDIVGHEDLTCVNHVLGVERVVCVGGPLSVSADMAEWKRQF